MKKLMILLLANYAVFSQMIFELKDHPTSITYYEDGSEETYATKFYYNSDKQLIKIENGMEYADLTSTYQKKGDTTLITVTYESDPLFGDESEMVIKQLHDNQGRVTREIFYEDQQFDSETYYYYNQDGDLIREVCKGDETDTTIYEWDMSKLLVKSTQKGSDNEIWFYCEYKIDNNKKITKATYFECDGAGCEETGFYADLSYDTPIKKAVSNRMISAQKSGKLKMYTINGRSIPGNRSIANLVFIRNHNSKAVTQMKLK